MGLAANISFSVANWHIDRKFRRAGMKLHMHESEKYSIEYWDNEVENKPVFLIVHGLGAKTKYQWYEQLEVIKDHFRIVIPNLLHFGATVPKKPIHGVQDQLDMLQFLLKELSITRYHLMGASYGGLISGEMANQFPEQVEKLILVDAAIKYVYESDTTRVMKLFDVPSIPEFFAPDDHHGLRKLVRATVGKKGYVPPAFTMPRFHADLYGRNLREKRMIVHRMVQIREEYETHEYHLPMPVHLIWGEYDELIPPERGKLFQEHLNGNATLDIIKDGGHMPNMNKKRVFNRLLKKYVVDC